jgi:hypothetical protein
MEVVIHPQRFEPHRFEPEEQQQVDRFLTAHGLNHWGDSVDTAYAGGSPCFSEFTGKAVCDQYSKLLSQFPKRPWEQFAVAPRGTHHDHPPNGIPSLEYE